MKKRIKMMFPRIYMLLHKIREKYYTIIGRFFPEYLISIWYKTVFKKPINLRNPEDICEKISWMKLHADTSLWSLYSDKVLVRQYVKKCGLAHTLNEVYGVYDRAEDIDYSLLPSQFVLKTNNGGGGNNIIIVENKDKLDIKAANKSLNNWLKQRVGDRYVEPHYKGIRPKIIAEKYLKPNPGEKSITDIKFYCFNGEVHTIFFCSDREFKKHVCYSVYDKEWKLYPNYVDSSYRTTKTYPKPKCLTEMIAYSKILSKGIPFVRVDRYEIEGRPIFSELTFTPGSGIMGFHSMEYLLELGKHLVLPEKIR